MVVLIGVLRGCTGGMSIDFERADRYEDEEQARAEAEYADYVDDCAQADVPAFSFAVWMDECRRSAAQRAVTEPAPDFGTDEDIPF